MTIKFDHGVPNRSATLLADVFNDRLEHAIAQAKTLQQRLVVFSAEHRRLIDIAIQSLAAVRTGNIGLGGATGTLLAHALGELRSLPDRTLEIRLASPSTKAVPD